MQSEHNFDGKLYTSATQAGELFGYTKEYMLMLAKADKIDGIKVKHKWYIHVPSAERYFKEAQRERAERLKKMSESRRHDLQAREIALPRSMSAASQVSRHVHVALLETFVIVFLGISIGSLGYLGTGSHAAAARSSQDDFLSSLAVTVYDLFSRSGMQAPEFSPRAIFVSPSQQDSEIFSIRALVGTTTYTSLLIAPDELFTLTTTSPEAIADSFSDDVAVSVDPDRPGTAVITPQFKMQNGEPYWFTVAPRNAHAEQQ